MKFAATLAALAVVANAGVLHPRNYAEVPPAPSSVEESPAQSSVYQETTVDVSPEPTDDGSYGEVPTPEESESPELPDDSYDEEIPGEETTPATTDDASPEPTESEPVDDSYEEEVPEESVTETEAPTTTGEAEEVRKSNPSSTCYDANSAITSPPALTPPRSPRSLPRRLRAPPPLVRMPRR